jgi:hypothetical protein
MVDADRQLLLVDHPQILEDQLARLRVLQKMSVVGGARSRASHSAWPSARYAGPGDGLVVGQHDRDLGLGTGIAPDDLDQLGVAMRRQPALESLGIGHRGRETDPAQARARAPAAAQAQRQQVAALAGGEGVDLVDDHGLQACEQRQAVLDG